MADRSVKVVVGASMTGLIQEFQKGRKAATDFSQGITKELAKNQADFQQVGTGLAVVGAAGTLALGSMIAKSSEFDQAMSYVQAATHESAGTMQELRAAAVDAGASTVFSATESANAIEELSKAGLEADDILGGGLAGSLDLAAAGGLGVARAAEIASTTLQQFKLDGSEASHVADVLAAGAGKAMGSVDDLAAGLKFVGPVAASMRISLEETTGVLALFAQQGIIGEQAGTGLRGVLASLTAPSGAAAGEIKRLGLNLYDAEGNFLGMQNAAGELERAYGDMDEESRNASMGIIFGRETITAATALYQAGAKGVDQWTKAVDDSGYAAETAAIRLDNLRGDVEAFGGALDTALIQTGEDADGTLRGLVQTGTNLIDFYNSTPDVFKGVGFNLTAVATAAAIAGTAFFLGAPKVVEYTSSLARLRAEAPRTVRAVGLIGKGFGALAVVSTVLPLLDAADEKINGIRVSSEELANTLETKDIGRALGDSLGDLQGSFGDGFLSGETAALEDFGQTLDAVASSADTRSFGVIGDLFTGKGGSGVNQVRDRLEELGSALAGLPLELAQERTAKLQEQYQLTDDQLYSFIDNSGEFKNSLIEQAGELGLTADKSTLLALATGELKGATDASKQGMTELTGSTRDAQVSLEDLQSTIEGFGSSQLNLNAATREYEASLDELTASVTDNGTSLDVAEEKGRANQAALDDIAKSTLQLSSATLENTGSQEQAAAAIKNGRDKLIELLGQFGITGEAADVYADKLGLIPDNVATAAGFTAPKADVDAYAQSVRNVPSTKVTEFIARYSQQGSIPEDLRGTGLGVLKRAGGGPIYGPGTGTSDSIAAWLSNGEHVITKREVDAAGGHAGVMEWRRAILAGARTRGYASGGPVQSAPRYAPAAPRVVVMGGGERPSGPVFQNTYNVPQGLTPSEIKQLIRTEENNAWKEAG